MTYARPPLVASASAAIPGAGSTTVAVVAAPGANRRLRLVGCQIDVNRAAGAICDCELRDGTPNTTIVRAFGLNQAGDANSEPPIPEPGLQLVENSALNLVGTSTAGAGTFSATVYYYNEPI